MSAATTAFTAHTTYPIENLSARFPKKKHEVLMPMATLSSFVLPGPMSEAARRGLAL